jgi:hypothetical protein
MTSMISQDVLAGFVLQIVRGMVYLEQQHVAHGDLSAYFVLIIATIFFCGLVLTHLWLLYIADC